MLLNLLNKIFGRTPKHSGYKIEFHRRYNGTYMLFGLNAEKLRWELLEETTNGLVAQGWSEKYECPEAVDWVVGYDHNAIKEILVPVYEDCTCCKVSLV